MDYEEIVTKWRENPLLSVADVDTKLHNFRILFAYHSGKIENEKINYHDTREIFENGKVISYTGDIRTLFEQQNQKDCYEYLKEKIINRDPVTPMLMKKTHFELSKGTYDSSRFAKGEHPGEYKVHDYVVGVYDVGTEAERVESEIVELLGELNNYTGSEILKAGAYFHAYFEQIHPFADGNGRVGRTLLNYYLMIHEHPPIIIFEEDKKEYYKALEAFDREELLEPLVSFLKTELDKTWKNYRGKKI